jgi:hypothetical protein
MESLVLGPGRTPQFLHTQAAAMFHVEDGSFQFLETAIVFFIMELIWRAKQTSCCTGRKQFPSSFRKLFNFCWNAERRG